MKPFLRRLGVALLTMLLCVSALTILPTAADYRSNTADYETKAAAWASVELRALYVQDDMKLSSDINPDFKADWPLLHVPHAGEAVMSTVNMRGFALSPDGRFAYMSVLHGGGDKVRGMYVMETMTGKILAYDTRYDGDRCDGALPHFSYPKGMDADSRGYVCIGYTLSASYNECYLRVVRQNEDGTLTQMSEIPVCSLGTPGDTGGTKVGINGVAVSERDGRVYAYVVTNYEYDALYCFDVTDPENPMPCKDFGVGGRMDLTSLGGYTTDEALYLDVAADGTVCLAITAVDGRGGVAVIAPDGRSCRKVIACDNVYSVELVGNFLLCGSRTGGHVTVLNRQTGRQVTTLSVNDTYGERVTRMQIARDVLFVCDAGSVAGQSNAVYAAPLSDDGQAFLDEIVLSQNRGYAEYETETDEPETAADTAPAAETLPETDDNAVESQPRETVSETVGETLPATTSDSATETTPETNAAQDGGCSSAAAFPCLCLLTGAAWVFMKRKEKNA